MFTVVTREIGIVVLSFCMDGAKPRSRKLDAIESAGLHTRLMLAGITPDGRGVIAVKAGTAAAEICRRYLGRAGT